MSLVNPFTPSFGGKPEHFFGRKDIIGRVLSALQDDYNPDRVLFITGNRGCGKTALLERLSTLASEAKWYVVDVHSAHATREMTTRLMGMGLSAELSIAPKLTLPGGMSIAMGNADVSSHEPSDLTDALMARCENLGTAHGVFVSIDEIQRIPEQDMEDVCAAVQMARRKGMPVMLVMAGLPGSKQKVSSYQGCTFMQRVREVKLGSLRISETKEAFEKLMRLVGSAEVPDETIWEMSKLSQGYPYLMQLVGYYLVRAADELYPVGVPVIGPRLVVGIADDAYDAYRSDVLVPSTKGLGSEMRSYLETMARLLDDDGIARTSSVARSLGKQTSQLSSCRESLIARRLIVAEGRGKVRFALPYLSRFFLEEGDSSSKAIDNDTWAIV